MCRIHENVRNVLDIAYFAMALTYFHQRIEMRRGHIGRIEPQTMRELRAPAGGQLPVLALDVMHQNRMRPGEQGWDNKAHTLAGSGRRKGHDMIGTVMAEIAVLGLAEEDAGGLQQSGLAQVLAFCPARRAKR